MRLILASLLLIAVFGCEKTPLKRVSLYRADSATQYWLARDVFIDEGFVTFHDEETGERVRVSGNVIVENEHDAEKP